MSTPDAQQPDAQLPDAPQPTVPQPTVPETLALAPAAPEPAAPEPAAPEPAAPEPAAPEPQPPADAADATSGHSYRGPRMGTVVFGMVLMAIAVTTLIAHLTDVRVDPGAVGLGVMLAAGVLLFGSAVISGVRGR